MSSASAQESEAKYSAWSTVRYEAKGQEGVPYREGNLVLSSGISFKFYGLI